MQTKLTREEALAVAAERKAARHARTSRIRRTIAVIAVAAFIGPFSVIYTQLADGHDPALASTQQVVASTASASSTTSDDDTASRSTPAAVTTQQS